MVPADGAGAAHGPPPDGQPHHGRALRGRRGREAQPGQQGWSVGRAVRGVAGAGDGGVASPAVETEVRGVRTFGVVVYIGCDLCVCRPVDRCDVWCAIGGTYVGALVRSRSRERWRIVLSSRARMYMYHTKYGLLCSGVSCDGFGDEIASLV